MKNALFVLQWCVAKVACAGAWWYLHRVETFGLPIGYAFRVVGWMALVFAALLTYVEVESIVREIRSRLFRRRPPEIGTIETYRGLRGEKLVESPAFEPVRYRGRVGEDRWVIGDDGKLRIVGGSS